MEINNLRELDEYGVLKKGDEINFHFDDKELKYQFPADEDELYLYIDSIQDNDYIFEYLGLDKDKICEEEYGYEPVHDGVFPYTKENDFEAITRVVRRLYKEMGETYEDEVETDRFFLIDLD